MSRALRILIVVPRQPLATGNHVTANRFMRGLTERGHTPQLLEVTEQDGTLLTSAVAAFSPDLVHLLHAWRSGVPWLDSGWAGRIPYVVSLTGTDLNHDIDDPVRGPRCQTVLAHAAAILTQNRLTWEEWRTAAPWGARLHYLPPGVTLGSAPAPQLWPADETDTVHFLHPAGIRPVKGNLELLRECDALARQYSHFRLLFCGPELDRDYTERFHAALASRPWARYLGVIPPDAMAAVLRQVAVVLNHSQSEGLANVLLEATRVGCPLLARAIPGNLAAVTAEENGLLYHDSASFVRQAGRLLTDPALRRTLGQPHPERYTPEAEAEQLTALYCRILAPSRQTPSTT